MQILRSESGWGPRIQGSLAGTWQQMFGCWHIKPLPIYLGTLRIFQVLFIIRALVFDPW